MKEVIEFLLVMGLAHNIYSIIEFVFPTKIVRPKVEQFYDWSI